MNVIGLSKISDHALAGIGNLADRFRLALAQLGPIAVARLWLFGLEISELYPVERKVTLLPLAAPVTDHEREEIAVFKSTPGIALPLIPDGSLDAITNDWIQASGKEIAGAMLSTQHILRRAGRVCRSWFAGFKRFTTRHIPSINLGLVLRELLFKNSVRIGRFGLFPLFDQRFETRVLFQHIPAHPGFASRATPGIVNQAHGHAEHLMEHASVMVAHSGERTCSRRRAFLPLTFEIVLEFLRADLWHGDQPDLRALRRGNVEIGVPDAREVEAHV